MKIGDEITIKVKVVDFDANPHGPAVKVEVKGFMDREDVATIKPPIRPFGNTVRFWIHRVEQPDVIVK